jgi:DNA-binding transcriptional LysR family regulator
VELTEVGRIFVEEARLALWHIDRAVHAAHVPQTPRSAH